jgi:sec-independent protein translocase protein TatA
MPFGTHWIWLVLLLVVVLIIFGPGRLPELGGAVGRAMKEFRRATTELTSEVSAAAKGEKGESAPSESTAKGSSTSEANPTKG